MRIGGFRPIYNASIVLVPAYRRPFAVQVERFGARILPQEQYLLLWPRSDIDRGAAVSERITQHTPSKRQHEAPSPSNGKPPHNRDDVPIVVSLLHDNQNQLEHLHLHILRGEKMELCRRSVRIVAHSLHPRSAQRSASMLPPLAYARPPYPLPIILMKE